MISIIQSINLVLLVTRSFGRCSVHGNDPGFQRRASGDALPAAPSGGVDTSGVQVALESRSAQLFARLPTEPDRQESPWSSEPADGRLRGLGAAGGLGEG